jgi:hypothetical protein
MSKFWLALPCVSFLALTGCEELDELTADRPTTTQREGIAGVLAHYGAVGTVVGDPAAASDDDMADMFAVEAYFQLLDPMGTMPIVEAMQKAGKFDPACVAVDGDAATWDCDISFRSRACHVNGSGSELGEGTYEGEATLSGDVAPCSYGISVEGNFTLVTEGPNASANGTLSINQGGTTPFGFNAELQNLTFCDNQLPNGGKIKVTGTGAAAALPFSPITIKFTGTVCGDAIIE